MGKKGQTRAREARREGAGTRVELKEQDVQLLHHLFCGSSLRDAAERMERALSTIHERAAKLSRQGLLEKATTAPNASWQLTSRGLRALSTHPTGGSNGQTRTPPMRGHRFAVVADLKEAPSPELLGGRLPAGWIAYRMRGWPCWSGQWVAEDVTVPVQIRRRSAVFHIPPIEGLPAQAARRALDYAGSVVGSIEEQLGLRFGSALRFEVPPEYAYPLHPVARWWVEQHGTGGVLVPGLLWVDLSNGVCELETNNLALAEAIERAPRDGSWAPARLVEVVLQGAGLGNRREELPWRQEPSPCKVQVSAASEAGIHGESSSPRRSVPPPGGVLDDA